MMKRLFTLGLTVIILFAFSNEMQSQTMETTTMRALTVPERSLLLKEGFPIDKYKLNSQQINQYLLSGLESNEMGKKLTIGGWIGSGVGLLSMLLIPSDAALAIGTVGVLGGSTAIIFGSVKRNKAGKDIQNATLLYNEMLRK